MHFADLLTEKVAKLNNPTCVGLDPRFSQIPDEIKKKYDNTPRGISEAFEEFGKGIIDAIFDIVPAVKPQIAFYEQYGPYGIKVFQETCRYAKEKGMIVIADVKRGDIGSTAQAYAEAYLGKDSVFDIDAITVNAYLGSDGIEPFIEKCEKNEKGIFILVKTSNQSSAELQDLPSSDHSVHEHLAELVESWGRDFTGKNGMSCVGAVVGATYPEEAKYLRTLMPRSIILVPGYGAQGGKAEDTFPNFLPDGSGAVVANARGIIFAYEKIGGDYKKAARQTAEKMKKDLKALF